MPWDHHLNVRTRIHGLLKIFHTDVSSRELAGSLVQNHGSQFSSSSQQQSSKSRTDPDESHVNVDAEQKEKSMATAIAYSLKQEDRLRRKMVEDINDYISSQLEACTDLDWNHRQRFKIFLNFLHGMVRIFISRTLSDPLLNLWRQAESWAKSTIRLLGRTGHENILRISI